ncbi:hypothetical protein [Pseudomonas cavernicola]|nr:hypothetical protein [Pseudomonas cavernicola]
MSMVGYAACAANPPYELGMKIDGADDAEGDDAQAVTQHPAQRAGQQQR